MLDKATWQPTVDSPLARTCFVLALAPAFLPRLCGCTYRRSDSGRQYSKGHPGTAKSEWEALAA